MTQFKIELIGECVADSDFDCDKKEDLRCFEAGEHGGVCEWLCVTKVTGLQ